jgi:hypothetical protein
VSYGVVQGLAGTLPPHPATRTAQQFSGRAWRYAGPFSGGSTQALMAQGTSLQAETFSRPFNFRQSSFRRYYTSAMRSLRRMVSMTEYWPQQIDT